MPSHEKSMENHPVMMNRVMLRFRPIAPKPAGGEAAEESTGAEKYGRRTKRKYVRVRARRSKNSRPGKSEAGAAPPPERSAVTLQLLPERSRSRSESEKSCSSEAKFQIDPDPEGYRSGDGVSYGSEAAAATWIVVERVTDTCADGGCSDEEIMRNLEAATCPGFVSDGANNVVWVNEACRRMAALVRLVVTEELPYFTPAFACRVRMVQQTKRGQKWNKIVACDVWRMEFAAGFAWKLDVQTALGLGV